MNKAVVDLGAPAAGDSGAGLAARQRRARTGGLRLAQAACAVGLAYSAVSVYWAAGGAWLLSTVGDALGQQGRADDLGIIVAVWAAVLKFIGAILPL